ncbi:MAG TPA: serine/threonine-protein kinase, partial [Polyangiaceae bacterium]|nr:serine/threonine-protein kinase [Polyangiaceae bacterium]
MASDSPSPRSVDSIEPQSGPHESGPRAKSAPPPRASDVEVVPEVRHLREGDLLSGKYRLVRALGQGGMGSVWAAHNEALDVEVAIKVIRADVRGIVDAHVAERLLREARAAAQLRHPAIVRIMDFGKTEGGDPFIVMELLKGDDLAVHLERGGRMSPVNAVRTLLPIAHAMVAAHERRIVHRDLKPENIVLAVQDDDSLQPKLIDFGVAKHEKGPSARITSAGSLLGSPGYMSPEQ